jgi:hypothetical protein
MMLFVFDLSIAVWNVRLQGMLLLFLLLLWNVAGKVRQKVA